MIPTLYKKDWKAHWKLTAALLALLTMYITVIVGMYDPVNNDILQRLASMKMSEQLLAAFGFTAPPPGLLGFLAGYLYGFLLLTLPLVLLVFLANRLVAALVDRGSMAAILATPHSRRAVAGTQALFLISAAVVVVAFVTALGLAVSEAKFPGLLDKAAFLKLNGGLLVVLLCVSGIAFFASCLFNESRWSLSLGAGLPVFFLLVQMLHNANPKLGWLKHLTLFSLFRPNDFVTGAPVWPQMAALGLLGTALYGAGIAVFDRKDLPL